MTIRVLCCACNTHLADTDVQRLDWPLTGEMFSVIFPGWYLRPGLLNLDIFCPACQQFPFWHDPYIVGGNAVGKNLNVRGADGKPVVMTIKEILMSPTLGWRQIGPKELRCPVQVREVIKVEPSKPFPCPACGAKKRFHKKDCPFLRVGPGQSVWAMIPDKSPETEPASEPLPGYLKEMERYRQAREANPDPAGRFAVISARAGSGPERGDEPVNERDVLELEAERAMKRPSRNEDDLRPMSGR